MLIFVICMATVVYGVTSIVNAGELVHKFSNPSFSGVGTSAHYLTIENQEKTRKDAEISKRKSDEEKRLAALDNTNYAKFIKNLESRIYARFSKEMEEALFGEACGTTYATGTGLSVAPTPQVSAGEGAATDCTGTMEFNGTTITFLKDISEDEVVLTIDGPDGNSTIKLPLNDFQF